MGTPEPTDRPQCGAVFTENCTKNSDECGTAHANFNVDFKRIAEKKYGGGFMQFRMREEAEFATTCTCEQLCMVKGATFWKLEYVDDLEPAKKKGKKITKRECTCYDESSGIERVVRNGKAMKKARAKYQLKKGGRGWHVGKVRRVSLDPSAPEVGEGEGNDGN